jgi:hypothetical protein
MGKIEGEMPDKPSTNDEWTLHSLNIQGLFFQRLCADIINQKPQNQIRLVATEYPVEYPPSSGSERSNESRLDIYARSIGPFNNYPSAIQFAIECKKNNPDFIDWVFFPSYPAKQPAYELLTVKPYPIYKESWKPIFHINKCSTQKFILVNEGRETRGTYDGYKRGDKTRTANDSIESACHQVVLATHSIAYKNREGAFHDLEKSSKPIFTQYLYIPIVVTTANLFICDFSPADVSIDLGELPFDKAILRSVESVVYEYPIPPHLQLNGENWESSYNKAELEMLFHRHVFIINSLHFEETLDWMVANKEYFFSD